VKYYFVDQHEMPKNSNISNKSKLSIKQTKILISEAGGVVPQGYGKDYFNYLKLIEKYRTKVQSPIN